MVTRAVNFIDGKYVATGSIILDIRTKTVGRIKKATGIRVSQRGSNDRLAELKLMIKDLDSQRDLVRLGLIKSGKVHLLDAFEDYRKGRLHFIEADANASLIAEFTKWIAGGSGSEQTKRNRTAILRRLQTLGLVEARTQVRDLPEIVRRLRQRYSGEAKAEMFNQTRTNIIVFCRHHLGYDDDSIILKRVIQVERIKPRSRRAHHPLATLHELLDLMKRINATRGSNANPKTPTDYRHWLFFMAVTGLRPTEFFNGLWERDPVTSHLRIRGVKTANASRLVPHVTWLNPIGRSPHGLHQRLEALDPPTPIRIRDFRRTASLWFEAAGIPRSRLSYYMGHGVRDVTSLYQQRSPTKKELDEDSARVTAWLDQQLALPRERGRRVWSQRADKFVAKLLAVST